MHMLMRMISFYTSYIYVYTYQLQGSLLYILALASYLATEWPTIIIQPKTYISKEEAIFWNFPFFAK